jgi:hypothetical protein
MSLYPYYRVSGGLTVKEYSMITDEYLVSRYPKTKDGFSIHPGMCVWFVPVKVSLPIGVFVCLVGKDYVTTDNGCGYSVNEIYGDRDNASAAIKDKITKRIMQ